MDFKAILHPDRVLFNVSGHFYTTTVKTLQKHPHTKLAKIASQNLKSEGRNDGEIFLDVDEDVFKEVLRYYRTGELHAPVNMCHEFFVKQMEFWEIDPKAVKSCCSSDQEEDEDIHKQFQQFDIGPEVDEDTLQGKRAQVWWVLTDPMSKYNRHPKLSLAWTAIFLTLTLGHAVAIAISSSPKVMREERSLDSITELLSYLAENPCKGIQDSFHHISLTVTTTFMWIFQLEMIVRIISCPCKLYFFRSYHLLEFIISLIELMFGLFTITLRMFPYLVNRTSCLALLVVTAAAFLASSCRIVRAFKVATLLSKRMRVLVLSIWKSRKEIVLLIMTLGIISLTTGPLVFYVEIFSSLIQGFEAPNIETVQTAYWWSIVTMTTVGYGDYYPTSILGYAAAVFIIIIGLIATALPVAIIGRNFAIYYEYALKQDRKKKKRW